MFYLCRRVAKLLAARGSCSLRRTAAVQALCCLTEKTGLHQCSLEVKHSTDRRRHKERTGSGESHMFQLRAGILHWWRILLVCLEITMQLLLWHLAWEKSVLNVFFLVLATQRCPGFNSWCIWKVQVQQHQVQYKDERLFVSKGVGRVFSFLFFYKVTGNKGAKFPGVLGQYGFLEYGMKIKYNFDIYSPKLFFIKVQPGSRGQ